jgi:hypothetical protein
VNHRALRHGPGWSGGRDGQADEGSSLKAWPGARCHCEIEQGQIPPAVFNLEPQADRPRPSVLVAASVRTVAPCSMGLSDLWSH